MGAYVGSFDTGCFRLGTGGWMDGDSVGMKDGISVGFFVGIVVGSVVGAYTKG